MIFVPIPARVMMPLACLGGEVLGLIDDQVRFGDGSAPDEV